MTTAVLLCKAVKNEPVQLGTGVAVLFKIRFGKLHTRGEKRFDISHWPVHSSKDNTKFAKTTCLDAVIGGHSKFFLVTGALLQKEIATAVLPALQSFEKRTCPAGYWRCSFS